jgi:acetyl esterase/lipase
MKALRVALVAFVTIAIASCSPAPIINLLISRSGYEVVQNLPYGSAPRQKLDVYEPSRLPGKAPVLLFFYGGSWQNGKKGDYVAFGETFAAKNIVVAIADYRLYPEASYPDFLRDCAAAFAYVHAHIGEYGGDPDRIFIAGHSAGAYNAVMIASDPDYLHAVGADISQIRGVIGIAGPYDFLPMTDPVLIKMFGGAARPETQPITYVDGKRPPMLLATGDDDHTVSPGNTDRMAAKLRSFGNEVDVKHYPGISHVGILLSLAPLLRGNTTLRKDMLRFVATH